MPDMNLRGRFYKTCSPRRGRQAGSCAALREAGCQLVGGHSTEGAAGDAASVLGFSVVGTLESPGGLRRGGLPAGSAIILTKALGVGILLAAEARREAPGPAVAAALRQMAVSNGPAAECLMRHGATACTDVTG
jgi:selenide, water dikinase